MSLPEFTVRLEPDGTGQVTVDGVAVPGVRAVRVDGVSGELPRVFLETRGKVEVAGVGVVQAAAAESRADLDDLLAAIDPQELDRQVLDGLGLGEGGSTGEAYLAAVRRFVRGD